MRSAFAIFVQTAVNIPHRVRVITIRKATACRAKCLGSARAMPQAHRPAIRGAALPRMERRKVDHLVIRTEPLPRTAPFHNVQSTVGTAASSPVVLLSTTPTKGARFSTRIADRADGGNG